MSDFRKVNEDDILKDWYECMEETYLCYVDEQDRANEFEYDSFREKMKYVMYVNEKYYRNGFVDGSQLFMGCLDK